MEIKKLDYKELISNIRSKWENFPIAEINDHVVRLSILQKDFHWHKHTFSDEFFYVIEGKLFVDFKNYTEEINPGQMIKVPKNVIHRTRSKMRTISLCFETKNNDITGDE